MTVIGDKVCSFPKCVRPAVAHIKITHHYQMGDLDSWEAVCQPHLECVNEPDEDKVVEMLRLVNT